MHTLCLASCRPHAAVGVFHIVAGPGQVQTVLRLTQAVVSESFLGPLARGVAALARAARGSLPVVAVTGTGTAWKEKGKGSHAVRLVAQHCTGIKFVDGRGVVGATLGEEAQEGKEPEEAQKGEFKS
jgi:hypothetical protein